MSFPHKTAFYSPRNNQILYPKDIPEKLPKGLSWAHTQPNGQVKVKYDLGGSCSGGFIPLASTGLEDLEGNEIFEGHILETQIYRRPKTEITCVVYFEGHFFAWTDELDLGEHHPYLDQKVGMEYRNETSIIGHALTDPDLVPDSFDVYDYFDISEEE